MADATLMEILKEVRWQTLKLLENVDDDQARFTPPGLHNTILWHAGHALVVVEELGFKGAPNHQLQYPADWFEKFNWNSKPATVTSWPSLANLVTHLKQQRDRLAAHLETLTPDQLDKILGEAPRNRTLRGMIVHGLHDEADHQGEIYLLKKIWKTRA